MRSVQEVEGRASEKGALAQQPECKATVLPPSSRQALIDFFVDRGRVEKEHLQAGPVGPVPENGP